MHSLHKYALKCQDDKNNLVVLKLDKILQYDDKYIKLYYT